MFDFIVEPGGDTIITLTNPNVALPSALPPESTPTRLHQKNEVIETSTSQRPITFLVSSKHLMAASPIFNVMLTRWGE